MKKNNLIFLGIVAISLILSSCATILGGAKKGVRVKGEPHVAKVYYNGSYIGETPETVQVPKSAKQGNSTLTIKAENYKTVDIQLTRRWSLGYTILDIFTGVIPLVIDIATGNIYQPKPNTVKFLLEPIDNLPFKVGDKVSFVDKDLAGIEGEIVTLENIKAKVKYTRPANLIEKQTKKIEQVTEEKEFYFNEIKKN